MNASGVFVEDRDLDIALDTILEDTETITVEETVNINSNAIKKQIRQKQWKCIQLS